MEHETKRQEAARERREEILEKKEHAAEMRQDARDAKAQVKSGVFTLTQKGAVHPRPKGGPAPAAPNVREVTVPRGASVTVQASAGPESGLVGSYSLSANNVRPEISVSGLYGGAAIVGGEPTEFTLTVLDTAPLGIVHIGIEANDGDRIRVAGIDINVVEAK